MLQNSWREENLELMKLTNVSKVTNKHFLMILQPLASEILYLEFIRQKKNLYLECIRQTFQSECHKQVHRFKGEKLFFIHMLS